MQIRYLYLCFLFSSFCFSQQKFTSEIDSFEDADYEVLIDSLYKIPDAYQKKGFAERILLKAKQENNSDYIKMLYYLLSELELNDKRFNLVCLDSLINISKQGGDYHFLSLAFHKRGDILHQKRDFKKAISAFINSHHYAKKLNDEMLIFSSKYYIGRIKDRIGKKKEALEIHRNNKKFAEKNIDSIGQYLYINSIFALAFTFKNMNQLDSASYYNKLGIHKAIDNNLKGIQHDFIMNEGVINYLKKDYKNAKTKITLAHNYFIKFDNLPNVSESLFYLGKIEYDQNRKEEAIKYFKKVDSIFIQLNDLFPELRENYILLSKYYKEQKNIEQQLVYTEKLNNIDSILNSNQIYISDFLKHEYDIPKIVAEKENLIASLEDKNQSQKKYIYISLVLIFLVAIYFYVRQRKYKKRFERLITDSKTQSKHELVKEIHIDSQNKIDVPEKLVKNILEGLDEFERNLGFLDADIKLSALAKVLETNTNYLSKTINHYKQNNINAYLNDLRAEYAIKRLKEDPKFRKYTIKAIAREVGFKSSETFSKTFYKKTGIYPSYFIKKFKKNKNM